jgi:hypothetical protein
MGKWESRAVDGERAEKWETIFERRPGAHLTWVNEVGIPLWGIHGIVREERAFDSAPLCPHTVESFEYQ